MFMNMRALKIMPKIVRFVILASLLASALIFLLLPETVYACSCAPPPSVQEELKRSHEVFVGQVLEVKQQKHGRYVTNAALFEVNQVWKGKPETQKIIYTGTGGGDCGIYFEKGKSYLVYAHPSSMYGGKELMISIMCDRTTALDKAQADLDILGQGEKPTETVQLLYKLDKRIPMLWALLCVLIIGCLIFLGRYMYKRRA